MNITNYLNNKMKRGLNWYILRNILDLRKNPEYNVTHPAICKPMNSSIIISVCVNNCFLLNQRTYKYWHISVKQIRNKFFITIKSSLRFRCAIINSDKFRCNKRTGCIAQYHKSGCGIRLLDLTKMYITATKMYQTVYKISFILREIM